MGYVSVDTIYEEEGKVQQEVKNDYISIEQMVPVEMIIKKTRFITYWLWTYYSTITNIWIFTIKLFFK